MFGLGIPELLLILLLLIVFFGASRLPRLGSSFGMAISNLRAALRSRSGDRSVIEDRSVSEDRP